MKILGIDRRGRTPQDSKYLKTLAEITVKTGNPVGLSTLSSTTNINVDTIVSVIEPFLLRQKQIVKTPKGRTII